MSPLRAPARQHRAAPGRSRVHRTAAAALAGALLLAGCTEDAAPEPTPLTSAPASPATTPADEDPAPSPDVVEAEAAMEGGTVRLAVAPVQVEGDYALLTVDFTLDEDAPDGIILGAKMGTVTDARGLRSVRLVDLEQETVYPVAVDDRDWAATTRDGLLVQPGATVRAEAVFAAPAGPTIDVLFPYVGLVTEVPVVPGDDVTEALDGFDLSGELTAPAEAVDAFVVAYDAASSSRVQGEDATVSLASDVLFAADEDTLGPQAEAVVDAAAEEILRTAGTGEVLVVGHTDDVDTDEYNQALSERRAQVVGARLAQTLGADLTVRAEGRGESEPVAAGTSPEARAANRRVEIRFTTSVPGEAVDVGAEDAQLPEQTSPQAAGAQAVTVPLEAGGEADVAVVSVVQRGRYLVGTIEVESRTQQTALLGLFGTLVQGWDASRGMSTMTLMAGAHNATLLGESSRYFPLDYLKGQDADGEDTRAVLADQAITGWYEPGEPMTVTVLWPDPGGDTVTLDVPDGFRITDIPVTR